MLVSRAAGCCVFLVGLFVFLFAEGARCEPSPKQINDKIDELTALIEKFDGDKDAVAQKVSDLRTALLKNLLGQPTDFDWLVANIGDLTGKINAVKKPEDLASKDLLEKVRALQDALVERVEFHWPTQTADRIINLLEKYEKSPWDAVKDNPELQKKMRDALDKIKDILKRQPAKAFGSYSAAMQVLLADDLRPQIQSSSQARAAAQALIKLLDKIDDDKFVQDRFANYLDAIAALVGDDANLVRIKNLLKKDAQGKPSKIRDQLNKVYSALAEPEPEDQKIHILRAWMGDLARHPRPGRRCVATNAVRARCEKELKCTLLASAAPNDAEINPIQLCGFDPVPFAEQRQKGVAVWFTCIRGGQKDWDYVAENPGNHPVRKTPWQETEVNFAILQSASMQLRCPYPVQAQQ